jgi:hypothetical protein
MRTYQHTAFAVFDGYDIVYGGNKSDAGVGVGVDFYIDMDFASPQRCESVYSRTARFRCVFGSTDSYGI